MFFLLATQLIVADEEKRAHGKSFRFREFGRIVSLTRPYAARLVVGLLVTIGFAALHTVGIATAFPVFQLLLEQEGLHGWTARTVSGSRLGVEFAPPADENVIRMVRVHAPSDLFQAGARPADEIADMDGGSIRDLLEGIADAPNGSDIRLRVLRRDGPADVVVKPKPLELRMAALQWGASWLPPDRPDAKLRTLGYILAALIVIVVVANLLRFVGEVLVSGAVLRALMDLRDRLYERILQLPLAYFSSAQTSDMVTRFVQDIQEIQRGLVTLFGKAVREPIRAAFLIGLALAMNWRVTITVAVVVPIAATVFLSAGRKAKKANFRLLDAYGDMIAALTASLQNLRIVKAYTAERQERELLDRVDRRMLKQQLKLARLDAFLSPAMETLAIFSGALLTLWLASMVVGGKMTPSQFATLGVVLSTVFDPLRKMSDVYVRVQRSTAGAERIFQVLEFPPEDSLSKGCVELGPLREGIEFVGVSFTYPYAPREALSKIRLRIRKGETVAVVGPNGSGKTTLMSLLPRLYDPDDGNVLWDGEDIRKATLSSLRRNIGLVTQDAVVFQGTPVENIAYGSGRADRGRAEAAARRAFADEFIRALPDGYDTVIGERGSTLSGGQRQRLAIARAIYRDAPVLIFDEATSQIDSDSEQKIQSALREFARDRTTIIIAHRLSTIQFADRIVVMDAGQIVDAGAHKELFDRCPLYRTLCETQLVSERG